MMRALVTGASGFVGNRIVEQLAQRGVEVVSVSRYERAAGATPVSDHRVLARPEALAEVEALVTDVAPQCIIHLAGSASAPSIADLYRVNTIFAANILRAAAAVAPQPHVLLVGSAAEYGPVPDVDLPVTEAFACRPNTAYGITKLAQTLHGLTAAAAGSPVTIARVFNPIGPGMSTSLALGSFAEQIAHLPSSGGTLRTGDLDVERDFVDVREASRLLVELALNPVAQGEIVNICTGVGSRLLDITQRLIACSGKPVQLHYESSRTGNSNVRRFVGSPAKLKSLGLSVACPDFDELLPAMLSRAQSGAVNCDAQSTATY
ncbi:NAD-dependent epimerase/dehydratase family protein [Paraburkholderia sp. LEh10]|uniref:NAD-dependent epimerase/dehydratase family protein n=1 Tax=Paraburkholderia sp. LEh10 TaxID=2821353 RepID=UPI001AE5EE6A|nr:NAD-dependent epimerase/dehydratase family protein [Paraburkholderia sp. LEh10]MBP0593884.1 NAD-dependent epimerase/dehydratase family protein [Paraburkholderia sp. LEh10]